MNFSDAELIDLLQTSDHAAYTEIYKRYYHLVFVHTYKKLRDEDQAKDIVQELFINLWVKRERIHAKNLAGYLMTSARNKVINFFTHLDVESKYILSLKDYINTGNIAHSDYLVRAHEQNAYIEKAIQSLPRKMKLIFELSRKDNLSHKNIAEKLQTSEYNVAKQVTNALKILKTKLGLLLSGFLL